MSATLRDIAEQVGRSITTVSRALAGYDDVSEATRLRVRQAAHELGYEPHTAARQLQKQRTDTVGFIIPTFGPRFSDPFFSEFLAGVGNEVARQGFQSMWGNFQAEGLVVRPLVELRSRTGERVIAKIKCKDFAR